MKHTLKFSRRKLLQNVFSASTAPFVFSLARAQTIEFKLKWANNVPVTHPSSVRISEALQAIKTESNGRVDIQLFPNNQLGGDTDMLSQVRSGAIDFFPLSGIILQSLVPVAGINGLAFVFKEYSNVWAAMDGDLGAHVRQAISKVNLHSFELCLDNGFRNITSSTKPIQKPADLKGFKIRVPVSPLWTSMFKAFEASPASINFSEVYSALQTKIVEGQENPLSIIDIAKLYEVQKFCSMTSHMWDGQWVLANQRRWKSLPDDVQALINKHLKFAIIKQRDDMRRINNGLEAQLKAKGMVFNYPERELFKEALSKAGFYQEWRKKFGDESMALLEKYTGRLS
ncbi:MAG: TRAP transporter substrate-binding protein [Limnohabitans sp.]